MIGCDVKRYRMTAWRLIRCKLMLNDAYTGDYVRLDTHRASRYGMGDRPVLQVRRIDCNVRVPDRGSLPNQEGSKLYRL
jgi:hypothetical protein